MHCRPYKRPSQLRPPRHQRGAALIIAMLIFALSVSMVVAMKSEFDRFFQRSENILSDEQLQAYLRSGEELAAMVLVADYDKDKAGEASDHCQEQWAEKEPTPFLIDGVGWLEGLFEDLQGRFNLNLLQKRMTEEQAQGQAQDKRYTPAQKQFIRLLQALGEPPVSEAEAVAITESVSDWLDADEQPSREGAEDLFYFGRTPSYRTANRTFASVSELRAVANITPELYAALRPWVTALPDTETKMNILTAPPMLLRTINVNGDLSPLSEDDGNNLVEAEFNDKNALFEQPVFADRPGDYGEIKDLLDVRSSYFLLWARVEVAGKEMHLYSVLKRHNRVVGAIARASASPVAGQCGVAPTSRNECPELEYRCAIPL